MLIAATCLRFFRLHSLLTLSSPRFAPPLISRSQSPFTDTTPLRGNRTLFLFHTFPLFSAPVGPVDQVLRCRLPSPHPPPHNLHTRADLIRYRVCLGWTRCCTLIPPLCPWTSSTSLSWPPSLDSGLIVFFYTRCVAFYSCNRRLADVCIMHPLSAFVGPVDQVLRCPVAVAPLPLHNLHTRADLIRYRVCLGWTHCCTLLPPLPPWTSSTSLSLPPSLESGLIVTSSSFTHGAWLFYSCIGIWLKYALPPLPLCVREHQVPCRRRRLLCSCHCLVEESWTTVVVFFLSFFFYFKQCVFFFTLTMASE